jgi:outer membrane receptor for ferric coprogen and ferric-rhodotorulic acid
MKNPYLALTLSLVAATALAQSVAPSATSAASTADDAAVILNPFVVSTDANKGYYASETLSGTQLKSQVRDLANPITILTEEFMRDIGAVNYEEALEFLPSTQAFKGDTSDPESVSSRTGTPFTVRGHQAQLGWSIRLGRLEARQLGYQPDHRSQKTGPALRRVVHRSTHAA